MTRTRTPGDLSVASHQLPIRGREDELGVVDDVVTELRNGSGSLLLVHGPPGIGKSRLLSEMVVRATRAGARSLASKAFEDQQLVPFAPLFNAFLGAEPPVGDAAAFRALSASADLRYWVVRELHSALLAAATDAPLFVVIDDAHWADTVSIMALSTLMEDLADAPVTWVLAMRSSEVRPTLRDSADGMTRAWGPRAHTLRLSAVSVRAAADIAMDVLRAKADDSLMELTNMAQGNPFLLVELLQGLKEDGRLHVDGGRVSVTGRDLPRRLADTVDHRLNRLSPVTRQIVQVASVLPETFSAVALARMVEREPSALIEYVGEAIRADLLLEVDDRLRFRHEVLREAARLSLPATLRRALERESAQVLLASGAAPEQVALQIARSAEVGDRDAVATLRSAADSLARSDPTASAELSSRAIELTHPDDGERAGVVAQAVRLLGRAQRFDEARKLIMDALSGDLDAEGEACIRLSASMLSLDGFAECANHNRRSLILPAISAQSRALHQGWLAYNLMMDGQAAAARDAAVQARSAAASSHEQGAAVVVELATANVECADGFGLRSLEALTVVRSNLRTGAVDAMSDVVCFHRANVAMTLGELADAADVINLGIDDARRANDDLWLTTLRELEALRAVTAGDLAAARAAVELTLGGRDFVDVRSAGLVHLVVLSEVAARTDGRNLHRAAGVAARQLMDHGAASRRAACTALAHMAWQQGDSVAAGRWLAGDLELLGTPMFATDLDHLVLAARIARQSADTGLRDRVVTAAAVLDRGSDGVPLFAGVAEHARGTLEGDAVQLGAAVEALEDSQRPLLHASALEDLGSALAVAGLQERAIGALGTAFDVYAQHASTADARRVSRALRAFGVERRVCRQRERNGWDSLTRSEWRVVDLVADGATNRQVADHLCVSHHTVNTHLRNIFAKLSIRSRDQLTRLARGESAVRLTG